MVFQGIAMAAIMGILDPGSMLMPLSMAVLMLLAQWVLHETQNRFQETYSDMNLHFGFSVVQVELVAMETNTAKGMVLIQQH